MAIKYPYFEIFWYIFHDWICCAKKTLATTNKNLGRKKVVLLFSFPLSYPFPTEEFGRDWAKFGHLGDFSKHLGDFFYENIWPHS
jgi:hypothetical protein